MLRKEKWVQKPKLTPEELKAVEENIAELEQKVAEKMNYERQKRIHFKEAIAVMRSKLDKEIRNKRQYFSNIAAEQRKVFEKSCKKDREELRVIKVELAALKRRLKSHYHYPRKQEVIDNHFGLVHVK